MEHFGLARCRPPGEMLRDLNRPQAIVTETAKARNFGSGVSTTLGYGVAGQGTHLPKSMAEPVVQSGEMCCNSPGVRSEFEEPFSPQDTVFGFEMPRPEQERRKSRECGSIDATAQGDLGAPLQVRYESERSSTQSSERKSSTQSSEQIQGDLGVRYHSAPPEIGQSTEFGHSASALGAEKFAATRSLRSTSSINSQSRTTSKESASKKRASRSLDGMMKRFGAKSK